MRPAWIARPVLLVLAKVRWCRRSHLRGFTAAACANNVTAFSGRGPEIVCGVSLGKEIVDAGLWVVVDYPGENVSEMSLWIDAAELGCLDERGDDGPVLTAAIGAGEERILAIESSWTDCALDNVGVDFDAAVVEEVDEALQCDRA